jgi:hypothetical protein
MTTLGYFLSCEEFHPKELARQAVRAEAAGFERLWGKLNQTLPTPAHFEQASRLVPASAVEESVPCGPDAKPYIDRIRTFADAGYDEVYIQQIGSDQDRFFDFWESEIAPEVAA